MKPLSLFATIFSISLFATPAWANDPISSGSGAEGAIVETDASTAFTTTGSDTDSITAGATSADMNTARTDSAAETVFDEAPNEETAVSPQAGDASDEVSDPAADTTTIVTTDAPTGTVDAVEDNQPVSVTNDVSYSQSGELITGSVVAVNNAESEVVIRDDSTGGDRRITIDPNVLSASTVRIGDRVRVELNAGDSRRASASRITPA